MNHRMFLAMTLVLSLASSSIAAGLKLGDAAPDFSVIGVDGKEHNLKSNSDTKVTVVCFTCNFCPVAAAYEDRFIEFAKQYKKKGVNFIAINVNPETLADMKKRADEKGFTFAYCKDETGETARAFGARVTPHLFVINQKRQLSYIGAFDDNMDESKARKRYLADAVDALLSGKKVKTASTRLVGCAIKLRRR
ncbi:MAG: thioredoxin family protein [Pirellulaceae bacterium]|nr:thioredoxin family protein [Planctomycetaceae bacterium]HIM30884.1 thioredoxin family protein [Planctomycetota bacterium]